MEGVVSAEQRQLHHYRVTGVDRYVNEALPGPHECYRSRNALLRVEKVPAYQERQKHLEPRAHEYMYKLSEEDEYRMASFVEYKINAVDKVPSGGCGRAMQKVGAQERDHERAHQPRVHALSITASRNLGGGTVLI